MATAQSLIERLDVTVDWKLEFRTWTGSAWQWSDYSDYLISFSGIGATIEQNSVPNAFRMNTGNIIVDNSEGFWTDLDTLDGLLRNTSQSYGKEFFKRIWRISEVRYDAHGTGVTTAIGVGLVWDVNSKSDGLQSVIKTISLDRYASDQRADGDTVQRHPIGSSDQASPSSWTATDPSSDTAEVALYEYRDTDTEDEQEVMSFFTHRRVVEVIERTGWAMDDTDLGTDIQENIIYTDKTASTNERATMRNIPPDDDSVSAGATPDRTRVCCWNTEREILVVAVGHLIYDHDVEENTYTLRATLTAGRDVVKMWYTTEADSGAYDKRLVLLQCDVNSYATTDTSRATGGWCTVLDAEGSGSYTKLANEVSLGSDFYPGHYCFREGGYDGLNGMYVGQQVASSKEMGENLCIPFQQRVSTLTANPDYTDEATGLMAYQNCTSGDESLAGTRTRGWYTGFVDVGSSIDAGFKFALGNYVCGTVEVYHSGGRLYTASWDSSNEFRLHYLSLYDYSTSGYLSMPSGVEDEPILVIYASMVDPAYDEDLNVVTMAWDDGPSSSSYSVCHSRAYDLSTSTWYDYTWLSGATGDDQAWTILDICHEKNTAHFWCILMNRATLQYRICEDARNTSWANTDSDCHEFTSGLGDKDQSNRMHGLTWRADSYVYWIEGGSNRLWRTTLSAIEVLNDGQPINTDNGIYSQLAATPLNWPDSDTPSGILFGVSIPDYGDYGTDTLDGEYVLWQFANRLSGFLPVLDVRDLSIWDLRRHLATGYGYLSYYAPDGTMVFRPRLQTGSASVTFSDANHNMYDAEIVSQGWPNIINDVVVKPHEVVSEPRTSAIVKGSSDSTGMLTDITVVGDPGETSKWRLDFTSTTAWEIYKLEGTNASASSNKGTGTITGYTRGVTDGAYLNIMPEAFEGEFAIGDSFTFWVFRPIITLQETTFKDWARAVDSTSINSWQRSKSGAGEISNRFIQKLYAPWIAKEVLNNRKDPHRQIRIQAVFDGTILPLDIISVIEPNLGLDGTETWQVTSIRHTSDAMRSTIDAIEL